MHAQADELETPMNRAITGTENTLRLADPSLNTPRLESAFSLFNPIEEAGLMRMWNNIGPSFSRSPTSQRELGRLISQQEDRDDSPFEDRMSLTQWSNLISRSYFTATGPSNDKETDNKHNY